MGETIPVQETFNATVQGEGFWAGTPCDFIRLYGCPVGCLWCDTGYAAPGHGHNLPRGSRLIHQLVEATQSPMVVVSGGEPFIHAALPDLCKELLAASQSPAVAIETSGSFWQPIPDQVWVTLSPKEHHRLRSPVTPEIWQRANEVKIVISSPDDLLYYLDKAVLGHDGQHLFLQPEWTEIDRTLPLVLAMLSDSTFYQYKPRLSLQTHKYIGVQ